jgi:hypothetical protein
MFTGRKTTTGKSQCKVGKGGGEDDEAEEYNI